MFIDQYARPRFIKQYTHSILSEEDSTCYYKPEKYFSIKLSLGCLVQEFNVNCFARKSGAYKTVPP